MVFNERIKALRGERALPQTQAAEAGGMTLRAYQRLENENAKPHYDSLLRLADFYGVSVDYLMGRTERREVNR